MKSLARKMMMIGVVGALAFGVGMSVNSLTWHVSEANAQVVDDGKYDGATFNSPFVSVAERLKPSVVYIKVVREESVRSRIPFFGFHPFLNPDPEQNAEPKKMKIPSSGSGVIIDKDGYIITNNHVVENATTITVKLADGEEQDAEVVGTDPETDLALIKIPAVPADHVAPMGDSDALRIGEWAIAMGNPLGLDWTLTVGVISAKGRSNLNISGGGPAFQDFIQTDASINFGNSGGPLCNIHGEVIGINAAINASAENIGFAIPINLAREVVEQLKESGDVRRGYLGMVPTELTSLMREALELDNDTRGVFVESVEPGTPADEGGLMGSDVIVRLDGDPVAEVKDFRFRVARHVPGEKMSATVLRDGKKKKLSFVLGDRAELIAELRGGTKETIERDWMGIKVASLREPSVQRMGIDLDEGVVIVGIDDDSPAEGKLRVGDVIIELNRESVETMSAWNKVTTSLGQTEKAVLVRYHPRGSRNTRVVALKR